MGSSSGPAEGFKGTNQMINDGGGNPMTLRFDLIVGHVYFPNTPPPKKKKRKEKNGVFF